MYWFGYFEVKSNYDDSIVDGDGTVTESDDESKEVSSSEKTLNHNMIAL